MQNSVRWSVVLVVPRSNQFVVVARGFNPRDVNFPGGDAAVEDTGPEQTALRKLYEETGIRVEAEDLKDMDCWRGERGQLVYAYYVTLKNPRRVRSGTGGKVFWTAALHRLTGRHSTFAERNKHLLEMLQRVDTSAQAITSF